MLKSAGALALILTCLPFSGFVGNARASDFNDEGPARGSEGVAYLLAIGGTVLPVYAAARIYTASDPGNNQALISDLPIFGLLIGPSLGELYLGSWRQGLGGALVRILGGTVAIVGAAAASNDLGCKAVSDANHCKDNDGGGALGIGLLLYATGFIYSMYDTHVAVNREERENAHSDGFGWSPTLSPGREGRLIPGAMAWLRF